jgi:hypothetical protein
MHEQMVHDMSHQSRQERQWVLQNMVRAQKAAAEAELQVEFSRRERLRLQRQHAIKASDALALARRNKQHAQRMAAAAAREAMRLKVQEEDKFRLSRASSMHRSGSKPVLSNSALGSYGFHDQLRATSSLATLLPPVTTQVLARSKSLQELPREARGDPSRTTTQLRRRMHAAILEPKLYSPLPGETRLTTLASVETHVSPSTKQSATRPLPPIRASVVVLEEVQPLNQPVALVDA